MGKGDLLRRLEILRKTITDGTWEYVDNGYGHTDVRCNGASLLDDEDFYGEFTNSDDAMLVVLLRNHLQDIVEALRVYEETAGGRRLSPNPIGVV